MKMMYLILHAITISFPLLRSFESKIQYAKKWSSLFPAIFITGTFFIIWDVIFTMDGVWGFNEKYLAEIYLFDLPIEEWLFFITVPFSSVFIYECVKFFLPNIKGERISRVTTGIMSIILMIAAILFSEQAYTFWNFAFTSIFLLIIAYLNPTWLSKFWIAYLIHLIPFLIINGILTGSVIEEPIVWYDNTHNMGIRLFTIPFEDLFYALLLLLMNVSFFEFFQTKFSKPKHLISS
ncbi:MAG: lycopene cyclase domain-containing protein [Cyclobacteriaceae bacterium]